MSTDTKHTPGPWIVCGPNDALWVQGANLMIVPANEQDAYLIAAAPDLLAALIRCADFLEQLGYHGGGNTPGNEARAAITKATGVQQ